LLPQNIATVQYYKKLSFIATRHILNNGPDPGRPMHVRKICDPTQSNPTDPWMDPAHVQLCNRLYWTILSCVLAYTKWLL